MAGRTCWTNAPRLDPSCIDETSWQFSVRGGAWDDASYLRTTNRTCAAVDRRAAILGVRCVHPQAGP